MFARVLSELIKPTINASHAPIMIVSNVLLKNATCVCRDTMLQVRTVYLALITVWNAVMGQVAHSVNIHTLT